MECDGSIESLLCNHIALLSYFDTLVLKTLNLHVYLLALSLDICLLYLVTAAMSESFIARFVNVPEKCS